MFFDKTIGRVGKFNEIWSRENGNHRDRHNDWVKRRIQHTETHTERCDDERKFTYLSQRETALHSDTKRLTCGKHAECAKRDHTTYHHASQQQYFAPILHDDIRVDHHADRDKEDSAE